CHPPARGAFRRVAPARTGGTSRAALSLAPSSTLHALSTLGPSPTLSALVALRALAPGRTDRPHRAGRTGGTGQALSAGRALRPGGPGRTGSARNAADAAHPVAEEVRDAVALPPGGTAGVLAPGDDLGQAVVLVYADDRP